MTFKPAPQSGRRAARPIPNCCPRLELLENKLLPGETVWLGLWTLSLTRPMVELLSPSFEAGRGAGESAFHRRLMATPQTAPAATTFAWTSQANREVRTEQTMPGRVQPPSAGIALNVLDDVMALSAMDHPPHGLGGSRPEVRGRAATENVAVIGGGISGRGGSPSSSVTLGSEGQLPSSALASSSFLPAVPRLAPDSTVFNPWTGEVAIRGDGTGNTIQETLSPRGYVEVTLGSQLHSGEPVSAAFDPHLAGATSARLTGIRVQSDGGQDTLILGTQQLAVGLSVMAPGAQVVTEDVTLGGPMTVQASDITVRGTLRSSAVSLAATGWVSVEGTGAVLARQGDGGGRIAVSAGKVANTGQFHADGRTGGRIDVQVGNILNAGSITADGTQGTGGTVSISFTGAYIDTVAALTTANGSGSGYGGRVVLNGGTTGRLFSSGRQQAMGELGGDVDLLGREAVLDGGAVDASGETGGGSIQVGGDFQGRNAAVVSTNAVTVTPTTTIRADAVRTGDGGRVAVQSEGSTEFEGTISARGGQGGGAGGTIEVSGRSSLSYNGTADAAAPLGPTGKLLLDPKNLVISAAPVGMFPQFDLLDPHPTPGGGFGTTVSVLSNGKAVVINLQDNFGGTKAGAVYLFDGLTGALISDLIGGDAIDLVGMGGVTPLSNGNYVIESLDWNGRRGAVTWASGTSGVSGIVSDTNSLVGTSIGDSVGLEGVSALSSGNYVVQAPEWNGFRGAVVLGNGNGGIHGPISAANGLVGTNPQDNVGSTVTLLASGNYLVDSINWNNKAGAVTWASGTVGITGAVSAANSLVGTNPQDLVGQSLTQVAGGNYVVGSPLWNSNRGAVTWGSGTTGVRGLISEANSLVGTNPGDRVGASISALSNGSYVVGSPSWNGNRGAATWSSGSTGIAGTITTVNSLVGANPGDQVAGLAAVPLTNGKYLVLSPGWNGSRGAVTWAGRATGISGMVSAANSLVGTTPGDQVGSLGAAALSNGNYVVFSQFWDSRRGAVTWGNGTTGISGAVSETNSLVGTGPNDEVGYYGLVPLANGNYVVLSPEWNGTRGAATWGNGATGTAGIVSGANSLIGTNPGDVVGDFCVGLTNGNYVVLNSGWNNKAGAVTWGDGTTGISGAVSEANSLVGTNPSDAVGNILPLANGNYVVASQRWNGSRGAVTWGNGATGVRGAVSEANSLVGTNANDSVGGVTVLADGNYVVLSPNWDNNLGAVTWANEATGVSGIVSQANSLIGANPGDRVGSAGVAALRNGDYFVMSPTWANGSLVRAGAATWVNGMTGKTADANNTITSQNSLVGRTAGAGLQAPLILDPVHQAFFARFTSEGTGRVTVGLTDPNQFTYARGQSQTVTLTPDFLTATLNTGTAVVLQASNDISVDDPITVSAGGHGGALTLQAGRSILLNASITTDNGPLTLIANDTLADGVVDSQRDPGNAAIIMAGGTTLDTGTAPLNIELRSGAGLTHADSRAINLQTLTAGSVLVVNNGPDTGSDIRLGPVTTTGPQSYRNPNGTTFVTTGLTSGAQPITFTDAVVVGDGVSVDAGSGTVNFAGDGTQTLQTGDGASFSNLDHTGGGVLQLTSGLAVAGTLLQGAGTFDANDQPVRVGRTALVTGGTYLAGTAPQTFAGGLVLTDGTFTSSTGPMSVRGEVTLTGGTFGGNGAVDNLTVYRGTVAPGTTSPGVLTVANAVRFTPLTTFSVLPNGRHPGSGYSQLVAGGPIDLGGSTLDLTLGLQPPMGRSFTILTTRDAAGIQGTFAGLPEGAVFSQDGYQFQISYHGGRQGKSVVLTRLGHRGLPFDA